MDAKIVIGDPPLGEQTNPVMVGKMKSGAAVIQTENGWITIKKEHIAGTAEALFSFIEDGVREKSEMVIEKAISQNEEIMEVLKQIIDAHENSCVDWPAMRRAKKLLQTKY